jgi:hypothetical protein
MVLWEVSFDENIVTHKEIRSNTRNLLYENPKSLFYKHINYFIYKAMLQKKKQKKKKKIQSVTGEYFQAWY